MSKIDFKKFGGGTENHDAATVAGQLAMLGPALREAPQPPKLGSLVVATEQLSDADQVTMGNGVQAMEGMIAKIADTAVSAGRTDDDRAARRFTAAQQQAATYAGLQSTNPKASLGARPRATVATESHDVIGHANIVDAFAERSNNALESFDDRDNHSVTLFSTVYNLNAARQDEFAEAWFPTTVLSPEQFGVETSIRLISVMEDVKRKVSGVVTNFKKRNLLEAVVDASILRDDITDIVPVFRDESEKNFVPASLLQPEEVVMGEETITTSALKFGAKFDLLGISSTEALIAAGLLGSTDQIDPAIRLKTLYLKVPGATAADDELFKFDTLSLPRNTFTQNAQGQVRMMTLSFGTDALTIKPTTKTADNADSTLLAIIRTGGYTVRLNASAYGDVNLDLGTTQLTNGPVDLVSVYKDGVQQGTTSGDGKTIADALAGAVLEGYKLDARRSDSNLRQMGQLIATDYYRQTYSVPLRSPVTALKQAGETDQNNASDLASLITTTRVRASNDAVTELFNADSQLAGYGEGTPYIDVQPAIFGITSYLLKTTYMSGNIDIKARLQSLESVDTPENIQAVIVNQLRDAAYRMWRDSNYRAVADALAGGVGPIPTVLIGTDPVILRYLMVTGDLRTLGANFNVKLVSTQDSRMKGIIFMTLIDPSEAAAGAVNPLSFGGMAWRPEQAIVLPISRDGRVAKELTVQPSYRHFTNMNVLAKFTVTNLPEAATGKISIDFQEV